ncbi:alpha/beta hydrolase [Desulfogranum mediterraneum]|uniref:alpha/beta hydrolase n=1 Tax=Desulfogranum mediterraneum TaxID=160661 RepID=UPI00041E73F4|nr:alpha/beta fold hydrolase [Desulfogranum mediterraneum]
MAEPDKVCATRETAPKQRALLRMAKTALLLLTLLLLAWFFALDHDDIMDELIQDVIFAVVVLVSLLITLRFVSMIVGYYFIRKVIGHQDTDQGTHTIAKCKPMSRSFQKKRAHVVILLHGFVSSPMIFDQLIEELDQNSIDYQAPLIYGFGINRFSLLFTLTEDEWIRQVTELYDVLATQYEHISVIGHSLGGILACYLAQIRPVHHLVLAAPAIFPASTQRVHSYLSRSVFWAYLLQWALPLVPMVKRRNRARTLDVLDDQAAQKYYLYPVAPTRGVFNILKLQSKLDLSSLNCATFDLICGRQDLTVDCGLIQNYLQKNGIVHRLHSMDYTGHNPFIDNDRELVSWIVVYILNDELSWPPNDCY